MRPIIPLLLLLVNVASVATSQPITSTTPVETSKAQILARKQTAIALRGVATPAEFSYLARLGDINSARKLAARSKNFYEKDSMLETIARYAAEQALQNGDFAVAEGEIKQIGGSYGGTELWLKLSRSYSQQKRHADARRTAFYAVTQVQREKGYAQWPYVALRLCELNEQATARRMFGIAQKDLLDPDPLWGSPKDVVITTAAQCGFDDIALGTKGVWGDFSLVSIYALKNRDDMARTVIERVMNELEQRAKQTAVTTKPGEESVSNRVLSIMRYMLLSNLAKGQFLRGDTESTKVTVQQMNAALETETNIIDWIEYKTMLLQFCESTAQWELADEIATEIEAALAKLLITPQAKTKPQQRRVRPPTTPEALRFGFDGARLGGFNVLFYPAKFPPAQRQVALGRIKTRVAQFGTAHPKDKPRIYLGLARAEQSLGDPNWRSSLQTAHTEAIQSQTDRSDWTMLPLIAAQWRQAGETEKAQSLGRQALDFWKKSQSRKIAPAPTMPGRVPGIKVVDMRRARTAEILAAAGLLNEALNLIVRHELTPSDWENAFQSVASQYPTAPPNRLLQLPKEERRSALRGWTEGLVPFTYEGEQNYSDTLGLFTPIS